MEASQLGTEWHFSRPARPAGLSLPTPTGCLPEGIYLLSGREERDRRGRKKADVCRLLAIVHFNFSNGPGSCRDGRGINKSLVQENERVDSRGEGTS